MKIGRSTSFVLGPVVALHLLVVLSIARQPLDVNRTARSKRSIVWPLYNDSVHRIGPAADFFAIYHAGVAVREGLDPYQPRENPGRTLYFFEFRYLPAIAFILGVPLSLFSQRTAALLWMLVLEGGLAAFLVFWWRSVEREQIRLIGALLLLLSTPFFLELHMGQFTFAAVALSAAALILLLPEPDRLSARGRVGTARLALATLCFTLAVLLKVFPLVLGPVFLRRGRSGWICLGSAVAAVLLFDVPYFAGHPGTWGEFAMGNFGWMSVHRGLDSGNFGPVYGIHILARALGHAWTPAGWETFVQVWRVLVLGLATLAVLLSPRRDPIVAGGLMLLAHFMSYHQVWEHHLSGALLVVLLGLWRISDGPGWPWQMSLLLASATFLAMPSPSVLFDRALDSSVGDPSANWPMAHRLLVPALKIIALWISALVMGRFLFQRDLPRGPARARDLGSKAKPAAVVLAGFVLAFASSGAIAAVNGVATGVANATRSSRSRFEPFLDLQLSKGFPVRSDLRISQPDLRTEARFHDVGFRDYSFGTPPWYSLRGGLWFLSWGGLGLELIHPKLYAKRGEVRRLTGVWAGTPVDEQEALCTHLQQFSFSQGASRLLLDLMVRHTLFGSTASPSKRFAFPGTVQTFAGVGLGVNLPHSEARIDGNKIHEKTEFAGTAWQLFGGAQAGSWRSGLRGLEASVVAEYKYMGGDLEIDVYRGTARIDGRAHVVTAGLRVH